jgi:hypothetical protein
MINADIIVIRNYVFVIRVLRYLSNNAFFSVFDWLAALAFIQMHRVIIRVIRISGGYFKSQCYDFRRYYKKIKSLKQNLLEMMRRF